MGSGADCSADRVFGLFNRFEHLPIDGKGIELHRYNTEALVVGDNHALGFTIDIDGNGSCALRLFNTCELHGICSIGASLATSGVLPKM